MADVDAEGTWFLSFIHSVFSVYFASSSSPIILYSMSNFSPNTAQLLSYIFFTRAARSSLLIADTSGISPTFSLTASGMAMVTDGRDYEGLGGVGSAGDCPPLPGTLS